MLRYICIVSISLFFIACSAVEQVETDTQKVSYQVMFGSETYQFFYPGKALISEKDAEGNIDLSVYDLDCLGVDFGDVGAFKKQIATRTDLQKVEVNNAKAGEQLFESWFVDDELVFYAKYLEKNNFGFFAFEQGKNIEACMPLVDELADSLSTDLSYVNDDFGFSVKIPTDFKVEYLENGVLLKKWIQPEPLKPTDDDQEINVLDLDPAGYKLEIVVWPIVHSDIKESLAVYIGQKYPGYSIESKDFAKFSGFFVNESLANLDGVRHFFTMNSDKDIIYEAYMTIPSQNYDENKKFFDDFIEQDLKIF